MRSFAVRFVTAAVVAFSVTTVVVSALPDRSALDRDRGLSGQVNEVVV